MKGLSKTGRSILTSLGYNPRAPSRQSCEISDEARAHIHVDPIPKNMHPEYNQERRQARAKVLVEQHAQDPHARFVDAAEYKREGFVAVAVAAATGIKTTAASVRCTDATDAEEVAIALAISEAECCTVLSDSRNAVRNFAKGRVCAQAAAMISKLQLQDRGNTIRIK
uniref:RNase H type-1 domain-containing protein n=1 Tax=Amblyomma maculatum TaxID=34609 RepID=G3MT74_AMBMU